MIFIGLAGGAILGIAISVSILQVMHNQNMRELQQKLNEKSRKADEDRANWWKRNEKPFDY